MNQWSIRRKRIILAIIVFVLIFLIGMPLFFLLYRSPSCQDMKQNGSETGVDCGGSCQLLCAAKSLPLIIKGDPRIVLVTDNTFEIAALVENPNVTGEVYRAGYTIKLYDAAGIIPIKIVEGETYVPKSSTFSIFEGPFNLEGGFIPTRAVLEWKEVSLIWKSNTEPVPQIVVADQSLTKVETSPRLDATIENLSLGTVSNIDLTALIYNDTGSIIAASKTFIDSLPVGGKMPVIFTWPQPFVGKALDVKIIIRIFPDRSFVR